MKPKEAVELVEHLKSELYREIEEEAIRDYMYYDLVPSSRDVHIDFRGVDFKVFRTDSLLAHCKWSMENSDDPRNQIELAEGLESIAKWLRKDAKRLEKEQNDCSPPF